MASAATNTAAIKVELETPFSTIVTRAMEVCAFPRSTTGYDPFNEHTIGEIAVSKVEVNFALFQSNVSDFGSVIN